jgi:hypothetical protein
VVRKLKKKVEEMKFGSAEETSRMDLKLPFRQPARNRRTLALADPDLPLVYFIGDSHVSLFSGADDIDVGFPAVSDSLYPNVRICRLGATLAATMTKENSTEGGRRKAFALLPCLEPGARVFLSFGEIDCRAHVPKRAGFSAARIPHAVESAIMNYLGFVDEFRKKAATSGIVVGLLSPPPTATFDGSGDPSLLFRLLRKSSGNAVAGAAYRVLKNFIPRSRRMRLNNALDPAFVDDWALRNQALGCMRDRMREHCRQNGLPFVDTFEPFLEPDGRSARQWFMDEIHLGAKALPELEAQFAACGVPNFAMRPDPLRGVDR